MTIDTELIKNIDLRACPRLDICKGLKVYGDVEGDLLNITHSGVSFASKSHKLPSIFLIKMKLMGKEFSAKAKTVWSFAEGGVNRYGAAFLDQNNLSWSLITRFLILREFSSVTRLAGRKDRMAVGKFAKRLIKYIGILEDVDTRFSLNGTDQTECLDVFSKATDSIMLSGEELRCELLDPKLYRKIKEDFRKIMAPWAYKSRIVKHGHDKPKGYPGDFKTLEVIYDHLLISSNNIGLLFDAYLQGSPYGVAVRNRKNILKQHLKRFIFNNNGPLRILNLASGSCREIRELFQENQISDRDLNFFLLDWDNESLQFSRAKLLELQTNSKFNFLNEDLLAIIRNDNFSNKYRNSFDFIYSIGLADYLPDRVIKKLVRQCYDWLSAGGEFVIAHKDREKTFSHLSPEWFCDWEFIPRNEAEVIKLLKESGVSEAITEISRDSTKDIFFITIKKNK